MDTSSVEMKLREAGFFLRCMRGEEERRPSGDCEEEPFTFYLSAFLNAAKVVDYRLRQSQGDRYRRWREAWNAKLQNADRRLIDFLVDDRHAEVHRGGSAKAPIQESVPLSHLSLRQASVFTPWDTEIPSDLTVDRLRFGFTIDGVERKATEACGAYLILLERMVADFKAGSASEHP